MGCQMTTSYKYKIFLWLKSPILKHDETMLILKVIMHFKYKMDCNGKYMVHVNIYQ